MAPYREARRGRGKTAESAPSATWVFGWRVRKNEGGRRPFWLGRSVGPCCKRQCGSARGTKGKWLALDSVRSRVFARPSASFQSRFFFRFAPLRLFQKKGRGGLGGTVAACRVVVVLLLVGRWRSVARRCMQLNCRGVGGGAQMMDEGGETCQRLRQVFVYTPLLPRYGIIF